LLGCRIIWATIATAAAATAALHGIRIGAGILNPGSIVAVLSLLCAVYFGWFVLPALTQRVANSYAEQVWIAFLEIATQDPTTASIEPTPTYPRVRGVSA
jgi:hypothetical protein